MSVGALLREHLADCPDHIGEVSSCDWCQWAGSSPAIEMLTTIITDGRRLRGAEGLASIAGVVAVRRLDDLLADWTPDCAPNNSALVLARDLQEQTVAELALLHCEVDALMAPHGSVHRSAIDTATVVATIALQHQRWARHLTELPAALAKRIAALAGHASPETQLSMLAAEIHARHCPELPRLASQPEWARCRRDRRRGDSLPNDGSLEALVLESLWTDHLAELTAVASEIAALDPQPTLRLQRPAFSHPNSRARSLVWRLSSIDWHATLADTGWIDVPWFVEVAIEFAEANGQISALSLA